MDASTTADLARATDTGDERPLKPAVWRGWRRKCPQCGTGPLMKSYLKVRETCRKCGLSLHDADAVHCKHCGATIHIETEGDY